jgi:signal transduction histidine kinase
MSETTAPLHVLVIEDDDDTRANLRDILELDDYVVETAGTAAEALGRSDWPRFTAIILDRKLPDGSAEDLLPRLKDLAPHAAVIIATGYGDVQSAVTALRLGAADYILKPINPDELRARLGHLAERIRAEEQVRTVTTLSASALQETNRRLEQALDQLRASNEEVRAMTQQLWQAAKLASVGELAAGIAHELNNPLATIRLRIEAVLAKTLEDDPKRRALTIISQEAKRMGDLVANLLQFSRRGSDEMSTVEVGEELRKSLELVQHNLRKRAITVVQEMTPDLPAIYADRQKLRQVFLNLLTNACDAMTQGGTLTLRAAPATLDHGEAAERIEVSDTGGGIPPENLEKVLEPFFTTKEEGKGTGLGLAICRRVVQEHDGLIQIASEVGKGTTVRIVLPVKNPANVDRLLGPEKPK